MKSAGPTRRELLQLAGFGAAGLVLAGCGDNERMRPPGPYHAAAVLEPDVDSFVVVLWSGGATRSAALEVRAGDRIVQRGSIDLDLSHSGHVVVSGLEAATDHEVTIFTDDGIVLGPHHVRTAPAPDDARAVRIMVSADVDPSPEFDSDLLANAAGEMADLYVSIGDFPYTDNGPPAMTVDTYRERHAQLRTALRVRPWMQSVGIRAIYDDHEVRNDWDAMRAAAEPDRVAAGLQVWDEFFPLAQPSDVRYRRWRYGAHVECFLLDTRRYRSANDAPDDAQKTMLGAVQEQWLIDGVRDSTAAFKLIFTTVPLDFGIGDDHWASFTTERDRIFAAMVGVPGLLWVSGDQHYFAAYRHAYGIREFQVGPVARGIGMPGPVTSGVLFRSGQYNVGIADIDASTLTFQGMGAGGDIFYSETFSPDDLTPR